jgi:fructokinase
MKESECDLMLSKSSESNTCAGIGLIALDIIMDDLQKFKPLTHAGGSCCNVLTILAYLGWNSFPIGKITNDFFGKVLIQDLKKWGVDISNICLDDSGATPIIIEKLGKRRSGVNGHIFSLKCPVCGSFLPRFKPITLRDIQSRFFNTPETDVFYFDRVSPSSIELAKMYKKRGAFVFFEPPKIKDEKKYQECYEIADVVKFSDEKLNNPSIEILTDLKTPLLIETMGAKGLQYRLNNKKWKFLPPFKVNNFVDAAGAGDWCSAGFIHYIYKNNSTSDFFSEKIVRDALSFGQCLSAINCQYIGARGSMYQLSKKHFKDTICKMMNGEEPNLQHCKSASKKKRDKIEQFCPKCK